MSEEHRLVLDTAMRAARAGGQKALARLPNPGYEKWKGPRDVVAGAVPEIQEDILAVIRQDFPHAHFLVEETDAPQDEQADPLWIIDPVDGSLNFLHGIPLFAVSVAYRAAGIYRVGVVYDPCRDELFHAVWQGGAFLNGRPIYVDHFSDGREAFAAALVGTDWRGNQDDVRKAWRVVRFLAPEVLQIVTLGSPALGLCYVAAGRLHAYYGLDHLRLWDVAAAAVILKEAGGILTDIDGASWLYAEGGYIASNNVIHGSLGRVISSVLSISHPGSPTAANGS